MKYVILILKLFIELLFENYSLNLILKTQVLKPCNKFLNIKLYSSL